MNRQQFHYYQHSLYEYEFFADFLVFLYAESYSEKFHI